MQEDDKGGKIRGLFYRGGIALALYREGDIVGNVQKGSDVSWLMGETMVG